MDLNFWLSLSEKQPQKPYSGSPPVSTRIWVRAMISLLKSHCWFASQVEEKFNCISSSLGPLWAQNEDIGNASHTLLTGVTIHLWCRLGLPKFLVNLSLLSFLQWNTDLCYFEFFHIINSISSLSTFLEDLIISRLGWFNEKFIWSQKKVNEKKYYPLEIETCMYQG